MQPVTHAAALAPLLLLPAREIKPFGFLRLKRGYSDLHWNHTTRVPLHQDIRIDVLGGKNGKNQANENVFKKS